MFYSGAVKKSLYILIIIVSVLTACIDRREYASMCQGLDSLNERNRNDEPFTAADVQPYIDYFDRHGEPNDRLLAYYLLGRAYHEQGEAPMALEQYHKAIECADTLSRDCDFGQLSRVYAQMGEVFYSQYMFPQSRKQYEHSTRFALMGKDTLSALLCYEQQGIALIEMGVLDSAIIISEKVSDLYTQNGYPKNSAIALGSIINTLISQGNYEKATRYMKRYEEESGLFNRNGDIEKGRETYYFFKGDLFLKEQKLDSAEYWYRRELQNGLDFSNQNGGAMGLAMVFEQRHQPDSAAKYYQYAYAMNDSVYAQMATEEVARMQAMYDYSRHQETARKKSEEAMQERLKWQLALSVLLLGVVLAIFAGNHIYKRRKLNLRKYRSKLEQLEKAQTELLQLRNIASQYSEVTLIIEEKENEIASLKKEILTGNQKMLKDRAEVDERIIQTDIYRLLLRKSKKGVLLDNDELRACRMLIIENLPELNNLLSSKKSSLNKKEFDLCILFRLGFHSKEISNMLNVSSARVSQMCASVLQKIFNKKEGGAKMLSEELGKFC